MISGYGDKEREFLDALQADTGRSLADWMEAISAADVSGRNEIIDWLRRQGFRFSRASWLERVHHNGGQPIYAGRAAAERPAARPVPRGPARPARSPSATALGSRPLQPPPQPAAQAYATVPLPAPAHPDPLSPQITAITAKAKAFRPLADYLLREAARIVPGAAFAPRASQIAMLAGGREFAVLTIGNRGLKLVIAQAPALTLTDAREIDDDLLQRLRQAAG
jgi:hypothetical protein